ncbi:MAG TPA: ATP-binding protein [Chitinophagaceae bacterium]|nr:ATP-binding protein [Chitinophagaceae bacterium]
MLVRFVVSNFLSFNEETEFNMISGAFKTHRHHIYDIGKVNVLKASAIYGANGAGKSNLILAFEFLKSLITEGKLTHSSNNIRFKLDEKNKEKPTMFEIEFSISKKIYIYGLKIQNQNIIEEWLFESGVLLEDKLIFERKQGRGNKPLIKIADKFNKSQKTKLLIELMKDNLLNQNELFLGKTDILKIKVISDVRDWLHDNLIIIFPGAKFKALAHSINSTPFRKFANELLETFDTGISELNLETIPFDKFFGEDDEELRKDLLELLEDIKDDEVISLGLSEDNILLARENGKNVVKKIVSIHKDGANKNVSFELEEESDGTQRLLDFIPAFHVILNYKVTVIIDEIDQSLHPALLKALIHKIMSDNTTKGQLIFTTHESNLLDLDIFRQDEIWFAEKNRRHGSSQLYSLSEFKPRYDLDIRKGYLKGRFGAIPFLANLDELKWNEINA